DSNSQVSVAALRGLGKIGNGPRVAATLEARLIDPAAPAEVKDAAAEAILALDAKGSSSDLVPVLIRITKSEKAPLRVAALNKLAQCGKNANTERDAIVGLFKDPDAAVCVAALNAVGAI